MKNIPRTMKIKSAKIITTLLILFTHIANAQEIAYNVFETNKGEIFKKDYRYIEYLFGDYLYATPFKEGVIDYSYENLAGIIDLNENIILPFQYRNISTVRDDYDLYKGKTPLLSISNGKGMGLFALKGAIFEKFTEFDYFVFRPFLFDGSYLSADSRILNLQNGTILKTNFIELEPLTNNLIATKDMNYQWGVFDKNGDTILKNKFDRIRNLSNSLISIEVRDSIGVLNNNGDIIIPPIFRNIETSENLILAQAFNNGKTIKLNEIVKEKFSSWTAKIKKDGKAFDKIISLNEKNIKQIGLSGAFDKNGDIVIPFNYELLEKGNDTEIIASKNGKFGILSDKGNIIADFKYDEITKLFNTFYLVRINGKFGVLAKNNKKLLEAKFDNIFPISSTEILYLSNNIWYKISYNQKSAQNKIVQTKLNPNYKFTYLDNGFFQKNTDFFAVEFNNKFGIISKALNLIIPITNENEPRYFYGKYFDLGQIYTLKGVNLGDIDTYYDNLNFKNTIICKKGGKYGVLDIEGKTIVPFKYSYIQNIDGKRFVVKK